MLRAKYSPAVVLCWFAVALGHADRAQAQAATATLGGTVLDESAAAVPDVAFTLINAETAIPRGTQGNAQGAFAFAFVPPGRYRLTAERSGFAPALMRDIVLNVGDHVTLTITLKVGSVQDSVTVTEPAGMQMSPAVATVVDRQFVGNLPLNGRTLQSLIGLAPGVVFTPVPSFETAGQFSVNGQRSNANYFMVDGVSANAGVQPAPGAQSPGQEGVGATPALNAVGGTQGLISVDALEEFKIQTSTYSAEFGRQPGGQISLVTRSGTNELHGSAFEYYRDDSMDAVDWFTKANRLTPARLHQNQFGGVLGGPVWLPGYNGRNRSFFFASYEGLRLILPRTISTNVPSRATRAIAAPSIVPLINAWPLPTEPDNAATGRAVLNASYSDRFDADAFSLRLDHNATTAIRLFGRYNFSPSSSHTRSLSSVTHARPVLHTATGGATHILGTQATHDLRVNYTRNKAVTEAVFDDFGGAQPLTLDQLLQANGAPATSTRFQFGFFGSAIGVQSGNYHQQEQFNLVDTVTWLRDTHLFKAGVDYRELRPVSEPYEYWPQLSFLTADAIAAGTMNGSLRSADLVRMRVRNLSAFIADSWRIHPRATLDIGVRYELNPAPTATGDRPFITLSGLESLSTIELARPGTPLYAAERNRFAPRIGGAVVTSNREGWEQTVRGGFGVFYDLGAGVATRAADYFPFVRNRSIAEGTPYPLTAVTGGLAPIPSLEPPYASQSFIVFANHTAPRTYQWNVAVEQSLGRAQSLTVSYVGAQGHNLLRREQLSDPNARFTDSSLIDISRSNASSFYKALQLQLTRRLSRGLQALASYTLGKAEDTVSTDAVRVAPTDVLVDPALDRGPADFDIRHIFTSAVTYSPPSPSSPALNAIFGHWSIDLIARLQSAPPVNVTTSRFLTAGPVTSYLARPNLVPDVPLYLEDPAYPGGRRINAAAFSVPTTEGNGNLPRNALRGFPLRQFDVSLVRTIALMRGATLQVRGDVFNVFNTPNFASPSGNLGNVGAGRLTPSATFGLASSLLYGQLSAAGGLNRLYQLGGPRSVQLSGRLAF